jgi:hypothetical protein
MIKRGHGAAQQAQAATGTARRPAGRGRQSPRGETQSMDHHSCQKQPVHLIIICWPQDGRRSKI